MSMLRQSACFERALTIDPGSAEAKIRLALALSFRVLGGPSTSRTSDIMRAETLIDQALAASPRSQLAHYAKAQLLRAQHRCAEAIPELEMIIASDRNSAGAYAALGHCKFSEGSIAETIPLEEKAIQLSPRDPAIGIWYWRIGVVHLLRSRTDEAVHWLEKACVATQRSRSTTLGSPPLLLSTVSTNAPPPNSLKLGDRVAEVLF